MDTAPVTTSPGLIWQAALIAWILAVPLWFLTKFVVVLAHEGGHAIVGIALFNRVKKIDFNTGGGGGTAWARAPMWPFVILVLIAGYAGPSLFGLLAAWLLRHDRPEMVVWGSMAFLVLMLFAVRGWVGWLVIPLLLVGLYQVATRADGAQLTLFAYVWTWFLLIGAVQRMLVYISAGHYRGETSDTAKLQRVTWVPNEVWTFVQLLGTGAALVWGGALLLRLAG
jgi:hypothetical protein